MKSKNWTEIKKKQNSVTDKCKRTIHMNRNTKSVIFGGEMKTKIKQNMS